MEHLQKMKDFALKMKDKMTKTPLQKTLSEATSNENWNPSNKLLDEIAEHTYNYTDYTVIMKYLWKRLNSNQKKWRRILKALVVMDYLIKHGAPRCIREMKDEMYQIRTLQDFRYSEEGNDRGVSIREKVKQMMDLLADDEKIEQDRENARRLKEKLGGIGTTAIGSSPNSKEKSWRDFLPNALKSKEDQGYAPAEARKYEGYGGENKYYDSTTYNNDLGREFRQYTKEKKIAGNHRWTGETNKKPEEDVSKQKWSWVDSGAAVKKEETTKNPWEDDVQEKPKIAAPQQAKKPADLINLVDDLVAAPAKPEQRFDPFAAPNITQKPNVPTSNQVNWNDDGWGMPQVAPVNAPTQPNNLPFGNFTPAPVPAPAPSNQLPFQGLNLNPQPAASNPLLNISFNQIPTQPTQPTGFAPAFTAPQPAPHVAKPIVMNPEPAFTAQPLASPEKPGQVKHYKNFSDQEASLINLDDLTSSAKKAEKKPETQFSLGADSKKAAQNNVALFSTQDELDTFNFHSVGTAMNLVVTNANPNPSGGPAGFKPAPPSAYGNISSGPYGGYGNAGVSGGYGQANMGYPQQPMGYSQQMGGYQQNPNAFGGMGMNSNLMGGPQVFPNQGIYQQQPQPQAGGWF
eukprot:TRINITY_DN2600_c0_g1_i8.p1 TRINITY_DN2600_c0_g1~~TRINITY_DN2600_c0_g1_i8.p1  ORF type:complete len:628 (+),score=214.27 TRINITY_DN2600_c0_g1_i8:200-2083(+)